MAARDRYRSDFECVNCEEHGVICISEDDYPFMKKLHRAVDGVDGNIIAKIDGEFEIKVTCKKCGEIGYLFKK